MLITRSAPIPPPVLPRRSMMRLSIEPSLSTALDISFATSTQSFRKHRDLQVAQPVAELPRLDQVGLDEVEFLPLGRATSTETVRCWSLLSTNSTLVCLPIANTGCSGGVISRPSTLRRMSQVQCRRSLPLLLRGRPEDPSFSIGCLVLKVGCAECGPA